MLELYLPTYEEICQPLTAGDHIITAYHNVITMHFITFMKSILNNIAV